VRFTDVIIQTILVLERLGAIGASKSGRHLTVEKKARQAFNFVWKKPLAAKY